MSATTRDLWLEDRRGVLDRSRDRAWQSSVQWVTVGGLVCAFVQWGWRTPVATALTFAGMAAFVALPFRELHGPDSVVRLVDQAVRVGLGLTGAAGIFATSAPLGLFLLVVLLLTAPPVRREVRDLVAVLRWARETSQDVQWSTQAPRGQRG